MSSLSSDSVSFTKSDGSMSSSVRLYLRYIVSFVPFFWLYRFGGRLVFDPNFLISILTFSYLRNQKV